MKKIYFLISAMLVMAACTNEDLFIDESNPTESALTRAALSNEYLDIKTTIFDEMDEEDWDMVAKAISCLTIKTENGLSYIQDSDVDELNMSKRLYNFIENSIILGNELLLEGDTTRHEAKLNISRVKTRAPENGGNTGSGHICTGNDCVGHSIAYQLNLDVDNVNNKIHEKISSYPKEKIPCWQIEATLKLFGNFTKQSKYCSDSETFPCSIPGIILIPNHAVNGKLIFKNESGGYGLMCYDHQKGSTIWLQTNYNLCASVPCNVSTGYYGYYK